ncbi:MAG: hypothetical protein V4607_10335 [Pseudomonadota bacterium]
MNRVHQDGNASQKDKPTPAGKKPVPPSSVQRQDTDYDVKPSIKKPKPTQRKAQAAFQQVRSWQEFHAEAPDTGILVHATQMGESEGQVNHDAAQRQARMLRALCG